MQFTRSLIPYYLFLLNTLITSVVMAWVVEYVFPEEWKIYCFPIIAFFAISIGCIQAFVYFSSSIFLTDDWIQFTLWDWFYPTNPFVAYSDVGNTNFKQTITGRIFGYGDIIIDTQGTGEFILSNVANINILMDEVNDKSS